MFDRTAGLRYTRAMKTTRSPRWRNILPRILAPLMSLFVAVVPMTTASAVSAEDPASTAGTPPPAALQADPVEHSVVKVFATLRYPDPFKPWTKQAPQEVTGSGVVIEGKRILTNAHVVLYAGQVQVQASQAGNKIAATIEAVAPGIDLAVLKLEDESFFDKHAPLERSRSLPEIKDTVMAYGYPTGGTSLSITKGIVSRIEFTPYNYPVSGLRIQIDAAINPGNSGGPAVVGGRMIGIAFSLLGGAQNIGYIIPCEEIDLFLKDIEDGRYDGKPALFDDFQTLENPALRPFLGLDTTVEGIVVHQPYRGGGTPALRPWDVVTRIGDAQIDNEGMVKLNSHLRVRFQYLVQKTATRGKVPLLVVRKGKTLPVELPVASTRPLLIPSMRGTYPSYFIYGPLVLSRATSEFVAGISSGRSNLLAMLSLAGSPLSTRLGDTPSFDGEELVVVSSPFLPHRLAMGYSNPGAEVVKTVNEIPVRNLRHLVELLRDSREEFIRFDFDRRGGETLVFRRTEMHTATEEILMDNGIRAQGSPDTLAVWNARPPAP